MAVGIAAAAGIIIADTKMEFGLLDDGELILIDSLAFAAPKTAVAKTVLTALAKGADVATLATKKKNAALFAMGSYNVNTIKSFSNFGSVQTEELRNINPVEVMTHKYLVIENPEAAFKALIARAKSK